MSRGTKYENVLRQAIQQRILEEIQRKEAAHQVVNNVYGQSGAAAPHAHGVSEQMGGMSPEDYDYLVDITRSDLPEINPATKKPMGWKKTVHRYASPKGKEPEKKKE